MGKVLQCYAKLNNTYDTWESNLFGFQGHWIKGQRHTAGYTKRLSH